MNNPLISVVMSVYNSEKYLIEAIESILNQTFKDFEFIIINDASTDNSKKIILSYCDSRIKLIDNGMNIGLTQSLNKGLDLALGKYIARMDADDISVHERLEKQIAFMELHDEVAVCGTCAEIINEKGEKSGEYTNPEFSSNIKMAMFFYNPIIHPSAMMRKEIIMNSGKYNSEFFRSQDYALWIKLFLRGHEFYNLQEKLIFYRQHRYGITNSDLNNQLSYAEKALHALYLEYLHQDYSYLINIMRRSIFNQPKKISFIILCKLILFFKKLKKQFEIKEKIYEFSFLDQIYKIILNSIETAESNVVKIYIINKIIKTGIFK